MFVLKKEWYDPAPGIELVEIHFTWTPRGEKPDWDRLEETRTLQAVPGTLPQYRFTGIEVPREVSGWPEYDLHYFFHFVQGGREQILPPLTEEIVGHEITYVDAEGQHTLVGAHWAVGDWHFGNYTLLKLEGLDFDLPLYNSPYLREPTESSGLQFPQIYEFVKSCPLPHVFRGMVHGPRGSSVLYKFNVLTLGSPSAADASEVLNNGSDYNWAVTIS